MSDIIKPASPLNLAPEALTALPVFPLPGVLLLPGTLISLHIFEPRYRRMMEDVLEGHRAIAVAMLNERGPPDRFGRPPVHGVAGVGVVRRSARLPDGRYNILLEGVLRATIGEEIDPVSSIPYRRVRATPLVDVERSPKDELLTLAHALRALCSQVVGELGGADPEVMERLSEIHEPGTLADMVAAAALQDPEERQRILAEPDVGKRIEIASGALGALMLRVHEKNRRSEPPGWGVGSGLA